MGDRQGGRGAGSRPLLSGGTRGAGAGPHNQPAPSSSRGGTTNSAGDALSLFRAYASEQLDRLVKTRGLRRLTFPPTLTSNERAALSTLVGQRKLWRRQVGLLCPVTIVAKTKEDLSAGLPPGAALDEAQAALQQQQEHDHPPQATESGEGAGGGHGVTGRTDTAASRSCCLPGLRRRHLSPPYLIGECAVTGYCSSS